MILEEILKEQKKTVLDETRKELRVKSESWRVHKDLVTNWKEILNELGKD